MSAQAIHDDLGATLRYKALAYNTIAIRLRMARLDHAKDFQNSGASSPHLGGSEKDGLVDVVEESFPSVRGFT
jgi:hypothetical protein